MNKRIQTAIVIGAGLIAATLISIWELKPARSQATINTVGWAWGGSEQQMCFPFDCPPPAPPSTPPNQTMQTVTGLGWVSMNYANTEIVRPPSPITVQYGVYIPPNGPPPTNNVTGLAWSENVGWIDFQPVGAPPAGSPGVQRQGNRLEGWARISTIANAGASAAGFTGWIKFQSDPGAPVQYGVDITPDPGPGGNSGTLNGYAWSNDFGWIDFSRVCFGPGRISCAPPPPPTAPAVDIFVFVPGQPRIQGPYNIAPNTQINIAWDSTNATDCTVAPPGWTGIGNPLPEVRQMTIASDTTFTATCNGPGGITSDSVTVRTSALPLTVSCRPHRNPVYRTRAEPNALVEWIASNDGNAPFTYAWRFNPAPTTVPPDLNRDRVRVTYGTNGRKYAEVDVRDGTGRMGTSPQCLVDVFSIGISEQ